MEKHLTEITGQLHLLKPVEQEFLNEPGCLSSHLLKENMLNRLPTLI